MIVNNGKVIAIDKVMVDYSSISGDGQFVPIGVKREFVEGVVNEMDIGDSYDLPIASDTVLGGVRIGENLSIDGFGVLSADATVYSAGDGIVIDDSYISVDNSYIGDVVRNNFVTNLENYVTSEENDVVQEKLIAGEGISINGVVISSNVEFDEYELPIASESVLGGIKVGQNLTIDEDGTLNAQAGGGGTSDNDKVAVDSNANAGYLEDVLDSSSDVISLAKSGNKLYLEFNSEITSDPKISTLDESMINADSAVYGGYNENNFEWGVGTHQCELYLHKRVADAQGLVNRVRFAITALGNGGQNTQGFRFLLMKKDLTVLGASDYFVADGNGTYIGQIHNESLSVPEVGMYEVKMFEVSDGSLVINRNKEYYIQIMTAGVSMACYNKDNVTNYSYDYIMKNNLNVQSQVPYTITSSNISNMHQAKKTIYCYMGATPVL